MMVQTKWDLSVAPFSPVLIALKNDFCSLSPLNTQLGFIITSRLMMSCVSNVIRSLSECIGCGLSEKFMKISLTLRLHSLSFMVNSWKIHCSGKTMNPKTKWTKARRKTCARPTTKDDDRHKKKEEPRLSFRNSEITNGFENGQTIVQEKSTYRLVPQYWLCFDEPFWFSKWYSTFDRNCSPLKCSSLNAKFTILLRVSYVLFTVRLASNLFD